MFFVHEKVFYAETQIEAVKALKIKITIFSNFDIMCHISKYDDETLVMRENHAVADRKK
jgi:hypothetical protein